MFISNLNEQVQNQTVLKLSSIYYSKLFKLNLFESSLAHPKLPIIEFADLVTSMKASKLHKATCHVKLFKICIQSEHSDFLLTITLFSINH